MSLTQQYQKVKDSVVRVLALNGNNIISSGSGSVIGKGCHVLTCAHCVINGAQMAIADPINSGVALYGKTIFIDPSNDIALLEFPQLIGSPVIFANSKTCSIGNSVFIVGFPMDIMEPVLFSAHIASLTLNHLRVDASVNQGNSGGPLFNSSAEQIGVVNAKHGSLSAYLSQLMNTRPGASISISGIDPVQTIQILISEMQKNLNLGIGYAVPTSVIKPLHGILSVAIPW